MRFALKMRSNGSRVFDSFVSREANVDCPSCPGTDRPPPCPLWVISCRDAFKLACPFCPRKLPRLAPVGVSAKGQKRTRAVQQAALLFDHLVSDGEHSRRNRKAE
jgi:hypothetical protein